MQEMRSCGLCWRGIEKWQGPLVVRPWWMLELEGSSLSPQSPRAHRRVLSFVYASFHCNCYATHISSVQFNCSVVSDSLQPPGLQHATPPCPSPTPGAHPNSCPSSQWWHPTISSSVVPFSSCLQSFPALGSFQMSQFFTWGGQSIGVSASALVLPMNIHDSFPLGQTGWISLLSKGLSRVFSNTTVQKH